MSAEMMDLIDEIAHSHGTLADVVTDFYFASSKTGERYKVIEVARVSKIVGGHPVRYRFEYTVSVWTPTGWVEVVRVEQDDAETATDAALIAERILAA